MFCHENATNQVDKGKRKVSTMDSYVVGPIFAKHGKMVILPSFMQIVFLPM